MPTYTYQCDACSTVAEVVRRIDERNLTSQCVTCGVGTMRRAQEQKAPGQAFRGKGWTQKSGRGRSV